MKLYVGNIPQLADEEALAKWFVRAGFRVEAIYLARDGIAGVSRGFAWVQISDEVFPPKGLRHLKVCTFWGRPLVVQKTNRWGEANPADVAGSWANSSAA